MLSYDFQSCHSRESPEAHTAFVTMVKANHEKNRVYTCSGKYTGCGEDFPGDAVATLAVVRQKVQ